jgi:hypothetical protein
MNVLFRELGGEARLEANRHGAQADKIFGGRV